MKSKLHNLIVHGVQEYDDLEDDDGEESLIN